MNVIEKYFPRLTSEQYNQFQQIGILYPEWNEKINVISRKDIQNIFVHHILHSLGITKMVNFVSGTKVIDFGTGGGFPGIPLAIMFPDVQFHLVDRIGKKLKVAADIAEKIQLKNVTFQHGDIKEVKGKYDFIVSRAVMRLDEMIPLLRNLISHEDHNAIPNGLICLKGGDIDDEMKGLSSSVMVDNLSKYFTEDFFETKKLVYVHL